MGTHDFKYNNVPIFARKTGNINTSMFAALKLALVQSHTDKGIPRSYENITLCHLNVCGWTKSNEQLRIGITNEINPDIFSLNETHLGESQIINVEGYSWKGFNRTCVHKDAPKASRRALAS